MLMPLANFPKWFTQVQQLAAMKRHRSLVILAGDLLWAHALLKSVHIPFNGTSAKANSFKQISDSKNWLVYSDNSIFSANVNKQNFRDELGSESCGLVFSDSEFNIDALAALSGTIVAGGTLFVLLPDKILPFKEICSKSGKSAFLQRFINKSTENFYSFIIEQGQEIPSEKSLFLSEKTPVFESELLPQHCLTQQQYQAVQSIIKVSSGHRDRPLVLTADRGRGKSCALAIACAQLLQSAKQAQNIIIIAPHRKALDNFFSQLKRSLPSAKFANNRITYQQSSVEFLAVDQLLKQRPKVSLLLVDEAAAIPVYLLTSMLTHYHRMVFSSTVHGYEGAGRGFTLKFQSVLNKQCPNWTSYHITQPIRWSEDDPLEQFIFDVCLLNAKLANLTIGNENDNAIKDELLAKDNLQCKLLTSDMLLANEALLTQVFAVLITAHYQTSPSDLKLLLDNSSISVLALFSQQKVIAVALLINEGGSDEIDITAVKNSTRRLRDQFLPQSLLTHCSIDNAFSFNYLRIMRIAVHPQCQNQGIGSLFMSAIIDYAKEQRVDFIGSSFGCNEQLLNYWFKSGYQLARIGFSQDAASGEYSALVVKSLNQDSELLQQQISSKFYQSFVYLLSDEYQLLADNLVWRILHFFPKCDLPKLTAGDVDTVKSFADKERLYSSCAYSLHKWLLHQFSQPYDEKLLPIMARLLKRMSTSEVCSDYQINGKKALNQLMLDYVKQQLFIKSP